MAISLRPARDTDAADMAQLVNLAGEGLPATLWAAMAEDGQSVMEVGTARAARDEGAFSWRNATIAEANGQTAGMIITYETAATPDVIDADTPPVFVPLITLENTVPLTRYINVLATFDAFRRQGVGRVLMAFAEKTPGTNGMSLIASDGNIAGRAFYRALGYVEGETRPVVKGEWDTPNENWIMLTKRL